MSVPRAVCPNGRGGWRCALGEGVAGPAGLGVERELMGRRALCSRRHSAVGGTLACQKHFQPSNPTPWPNSFSLTASPICLAEHSACNRTQVRTAERLSVTDTHCSLCLGQPAFARLSPLPVAKSSTS